MRAFFGQHLAALRNALYRLFSSPLNTILSLVAIGVALALPAAGWTVLNNLQQLAGQVSGIKEISVFMATGANRKEVDEIEARLRDAKPGKWRFVSRDEALKHLQSIDGMSEVVAGLSKNPLPDAYVIEPDDSGTESLEALATTFKSWPRVAHVQIDSAWSRRLDAFLRVGNLSIILLAAVFAGALVAVTFNTIRLQIMARAAEIEVGWLVGATDAFIRRPFLYFGILQGALGGGFAVLLVYAGGWFLTVPLNELLALYQSAFVPQGLLPLQMAGVVGAGIVLGWLGAQLSVAIHLRRTGG